MNVKSAKLLVIEPRGGGFRENKRLSGVVEYALYSIPHETVYTAEAFERYMKERRTVKEEEEHLRYLMFVLDLGENGINPEYYRLLSFLRAQWDKKLLDGFTAGLITDSSSELYTKYTAKELVFAANGAGCAFVGRPLVEGTKTLSNFKVAAKNMETDCLTAYKESARRLVSGLVEFHRQRWESPELLVLHASSHATSNTFDLWSQVKKHLEGIRITEIGLRNGTLADCSGCPFQMCLHYGEKGSCFYGGVMVEDVYPAVKRAAAILMLCPNYNDALSANLTAFINRLTALFRTTSFQEKALFGIVVSGYSGGDVVAGQLIAALNMNKSFYLPGCFAMLETANDAGTALKLSGIARRTEIFAGRLADTLGVGKSV